jgi:drug/metabolite transporter (DMT)-like permease
LKKIPIDTPFNLFTMSVNIKNNAPALLIFISFATIYIVWGSTYFFIRVAVTGGIPPFILGALRYTSAGLLLMTWCAIKGEKIFVWRNIMHAAISGFLLLFISNGAVSWAEQTLPGAMVAIVLSCPPLWIVLLDRKNWSANFKNKWTIAGLVIGFSGVLLLFGEQAKGIFLNGAAHSNLPWMLLLVIGTLGFALGSLYFKYNLTSGSAPVNSAWQMLAAGFVFVPAGLAHDEYSNLHLQNIPFNSWMSVIYLSIFGSVAAFSAYTFLLKVRPATQVSTYAYVNPVVAVILGVAFAHESISLLQLGGLLVILVSVLLINLGKYRRVRKTEKSGSPKEAAVADC